MRLAIACLGMAAVLAGCGGGPADMSDPAGTVTAAGPVTAASCGADKYQGLVGKNEMIVQSTSLPSPARIFQTGSPILQNANPQRLNIEFNTARVITRVFCG